MSWYEFRKKIPLLLGSAVSGCRATTGKQTKYIFTTLITSPPTDNLFGPFLPIA